MAIQDPYHKVSFDAQAETNGTGRGDDDVGEEAQFLPTEQPLQNATPKSTQRYVVLMCAQFVFMIGFSEFIMDPPLQAIMEDFVCHSQYPDHASGSWKVQDTRCKSHDVQQTLAMARSWLMWASMLVSLLVQIPYGIAADRHGRRPVLFLGLFGVVLATIWYMIVLLQPDVFSIWHLLFAAIPSLIGGGAPVIQAMVWTVLSDCIPPTERTSIFYKLHAMMLILSAAFRPLAAWLMSINPWLPMWLGLVALIVSMFSTLLIPETLHFHSSKRDERAAEVEESGRQPGLNNLLRFKQSIVKIAFSTAKKDVYKTWSVLSESKNVMPLIVGYGLCYPIYIAFEMNMLQYMTKRFNWDWSTATYFTTISKVTSVAVLLIILPLLSLLLVKRVGLSTLYSDLYLSRGSILFITAGNAFTAIAAAPWLLVASLIIFSFGNGFQPQLRAILAGIVDPQTLATLNTAIATVETLMGLVTIPALGWLLGKGIEMGGVWMGLPFVATTLCAALAAVSMFVFRIPRDVVQQQERFELRLRSRK